MILKINLFVFVCFLIKVNLELRGNWTLIFIDFADLLQKPSVNLTLTYYNIFLIKSISIYFCFNLTSSPINYIKSNIN